MKNISSCSFVCHSLGRISKSTPWTVTVPLISHGMLLDARLMRHKYIQQTSLAVWISTSRPIFEPFRASVREWLKWHCGIFKHIWWGCPKLKYFWLRLYQIVSVVPICSLLTSAHQFAPNKISATNIVFLQQLNRKLPHFGESHKYLSRNSKLKLCNAWYF